MVRSTVVATVPWADEPPGLPRRMRQAPSSAWVLPDEVHLEFAPVHVRRDDSGALWVTNGEKRIIRCGSPDSIELPGDCGELLDFAVLTNRSYGLLDRTEDGSRVRWYGDAGPAWEHTGDFGKLLAGPRRIYASERHGPALVAWDADDGRLVGNRLRSPDAGEPFLVDGTICAVFTDFAKGHRGVELLHQDGRVTRTESPGAEHYAWLVHPIGFDRTHTPYALRDGELARIPSSGPIEPLGPVGADVSAGPLRVEPTGQILVAVPSPAGVSVLTLTSDR